MRFLVLIFLTASLFSCKTNRDAEQITATISTSEECRELVAFLKESWKKNKEGYFYFSEKTNKNGKTYSSSQMQNCLRGMTKKEINKIFGAPSAQIHNRFYYYMSAECAQGNPPDNFNRRCVLLIIYFDDNERVGGIPAIMPYRSPHY